MFFTWYIIFDMRDIENISSIIIIFFCVQDVTSAEVTSDPLLPSDTEQTPPMPTVCLQFDGGKLDRWNRR